MKTALGCVAGNFAVGIAGDVLKCGRSFRFLIQPMDGDNGKYLVYGPRVGQGLEQREVAEILVGQQRRELAQLFRGVLCTVDRKVNFPDNGKIKLLHLSTCF